MSWIADATALSTFRMSPESFRLRYRQHLRAPSTLDNQAEAGSALHAAVDVWFRKPTSDLNAALAALRAAWGDEPQFVEQKRPLATMERALAAYAARYPREADGFTVVHNESYVEAAIEYAEAGLGGLGFRYCGIIDRLVEMPDGSRYVLDLKSTGRYLSPDYFKLLRQSDQLIGYVALERALGRRCDGFYIDAVYVGDTKTHKHPEAVREGPVLVPPWRVERWAADTAWTLSQIAALEGLRGLDSPWPVYHNWAYGKPDAYWQFVEQPEDLHKALRAGFVVEPWDPKAVAAQRQQLNPQGVQ